MSDSIDSINKAFSAEPKLRKRIYDAINEIPQYASLFEDIARYHLSTQDHGAYTNGSTADVAEQPGKKRKLDNGDAVASSQPTQGQPRQVILEARDISFTLPQRKKLHLGIVQYGPALEDKSTTFSIQGRNPSTNQVEFEYPAATFAYALRVPVPEKAQKQYNFCLLPANEKNSSTEALIWTINHGPLKSCQISSPELAQIASGPDDILEKAFGFILEKAGTKLVFPSEAEFASSLRESHRKTELAYHVKAFRGSKEGYLFFLENGIFFGFKKPLTFFSFPEIESISYTSVLQRTFNLNILVRTNQYEEPQEVEFSMLDQADFAGIDAYVKNHQLQDASLAEARRAKKVKANAGQKNANADATTADPEDDRTELEKAEAELEDEEDEMEEDYDPEAEDGDGSDGSGSESGDDDYEYKAGKGRNLVKDELGSEAEDVSVTEEGEDNGDEDEAEEEEEEVEEEEQPEEEFKEEQPQRDQMQVAQHTQVPPSRIVPIDPNAPSLDDEDQL